VRSALSGIKGVKSTDVSLGKATVKVEKGKVKASELIKAIKKAGYTAKVEK